MLLGRTFRRVLALLVAVAFSFAAVVSAGSAGAGSIPVGGPTMADAADENCGICSSGTSGSAMESMCVSVCAALAAALVPDAFAVARSDPTVAASPASTPIRSGTVSPEPHPPK